MTNIIGQDIGRYHIIDQLGEGGMATVYKAFDTRLEREVAVKFIRRDMILPAQAERLFKRFEREAKRMAQFTHPNIVPIMDYGEYDGSLYLVMPYLTGGTLKTRTGKPIPYQEAAALLAPIARALEYAHEEDTIHRDVKPANILLTRKGLPMLADFGIAKILDLDEGQTLTGTGVGVGTPKYMAPEQWENLISPQTDVYALGVVFFELITGKVPYDAETPAKIMKKQILEPLPRPVQFVAGLPEQVERILFKALAKNPEDRYLQMEDFAKDMEKLAQMDSRPAYPSQPAEVTMDYNDPGESIWAIPSQPLRSKPFEEDKTPTPSSPMFFQPGSRGTAVQASADASAYFERAMQAYQQKRYLQAKILLEEVLKIDPKRRRGEVDIEKMLLEIEEKIPLHRDYGKKKFFSWAVMREIWVINLCFSLVIIFIIFGSLPDMPHALFLNYSYNSITVDDVFLAGFFVLGVFITFIISFWLQWWYLRRYMPISQR